MNSLEEKYRQLTKKIESKSITSSTFLKELNNLCIDAMNHGQIAWHLYFKSSIAFHQIPDQKIHKGSFTRPPRTQDNFYDRPFQTIQYPCQGRSVIYWSQVKADLSEGSKGEKVIDDCT